MENIDPNRFYSNIFDNYFNKSDNNNQKELSTTTLKPITNEENTSEIVYMVPTPPTVGVKPDTVTIDEPIYTNKGPQPFTILMNFQNDGTTSLQILNQQNLFWSDIGNCRHGQIYDPASGICRDVFCIAGYILSPQGCIADSSYNQTEYTQPIKKPSPEMNIEITLIHKLCTFEKNVNDTVKCNHPLVMTPNLEFLQGFTKNLSKNLQITNERISNISVVSHEIYNETIFNFLKRKKRDIKSEENRGAFSVIIESYESLKLSFTLLDYKKFQNETKETIILFYYLNMIALDKISFKIYNHAAFLTKVTELKESPYDGWCNSPGDEKLSFRDNFLILASFEDPKKPKYYVYVNKTQTLYGTGYYYLTVLFTKKPESLAQVVTTKKPDLLDEKDRLLLKKINFDPKHQQIYSDDDEEIYESKREIKSHISMITLSDVTDIVLDQNSTTVVSSKLLYVCNRIPKIRVECKNFETIRVRLCELKLMTDRSYCSLALKKCFLLDEYEYDPLEPESYIRVCKSHSEIKDKPFSISSLNIKADVNKTISGWVSFLSTVISLIFMFFTLFTYFMFKQIRNLPGWNIINVTLALTIGQLGFLLGSFLNLIPLVCFLLGLLTHYGFLASFFWMNVIAFDLYRNFCNKSSLVLIQSIRLKDRLPKYSLYAWIIPFLIVLTGLIFDLSVSNSKLVFKPCYSGYLKGCSYDSETYYLIKNNTDINMSKRTANESENECFLDKTDVPKILVVNGPCWIRNGMANLLYFGLPIGIIILVNGVFYFLTIYNIRKKKKEQKANLRRISKVNLPGDEDVKFYIQMACIMGFTWVIGFFLTTISPNADSPLPVEIIFNIFTYLFILLNASTGVFIFFAFLFRKDVINLYKKLLCEKLYSNEKNSMRKGSVSFIGRFEGHKRSRNRENSSSSTAIFDVSSNSNSNRTKSSISSTTSSTTEQINSLAKENIIFESDECQSVNKVNLDFPGENEEIHI
ncbi:unnamed protein product [Brachionus calyciflorus]|uniref:G-protein coupled receptors family 2 profile 2 domain-containing protein n=1 Tax=Brachionus calyciflorus TaxID=104777 RepID=A0A813TMZ4_9BILA|nr:unnamed protein product [Brachionus calyciflorus]